MTNLKLALLVAVGLIAIASAQSENDRPIIGLVTTPSDFPSSFDPSSYSYFRASYVKWIEAGGARVVYIPYTLSSGDLETLLGDVNGVVFPGGYASLTNANGASSAYLSAVSTILNFAVQQNQQGNYYPVFGIDQGFLAIALSISGDNSILESVNAASTLSSLQFTSAAGSSKLFSNFPSYVTSYASSNAAFWFNNTLGISATSFSSNGNLSLFNVLSTTTIGGNTFVSSFEGTNLPIYGVQFHPESNGFDWDSNTYTHEYLSVYASQLLSNQFIDETRNNANLFPTPTIEDTCLIYNQNATLISGVWAQLYFFSNSIESCLNQAPFHTLDEPFWYTAD